MATTINKITMPNGSAFDLVKRELTQAQYDVLTEAEKNDGTVYLITDTGAIISNSVVYSEDATKYDHNFANQYDSTISYGLGDWCIHDHSLYRCKVSSAGPEEWDPAHWDAISVNNLIWDNSVLPSATWSSVALNSAFNTVNLNCAPNYDPTSTYEVGDWCIYANILYQCTTAIPTAENWNSSHWTARQLTNQDINSLRDVQIDSSTLTTGQALVYKNGHWENGAGGGGGATSLDDLTDVELTTPTANETLVCEIVNNDPVFKNKATTWTGTEAEYNAILVKDPNVTYYITDGDSDARYIICTQAQYNAWKTAGTLESDTPYYITDAENSGVVINDTAASRDTVYSSAEVEDLLSDKQDATDNSLDTTNKTIVGAINELKGRLGVDSANSTSAISVNGTYQIPANVLNHTFIIIACRRAGYGNSIMFKKDELLTFDNGFTFLGTGGGYYTLKCSNTGLLTVTNITNLTEPYILVTGLL